MLVLFMTVELHLGHLFLLMFISPILNNPIIPNMIKIKGTMPASILLDFDV